ncbi:MAG: FkbM family methyltransferase [Pseudomonadota bacterium]
MTVQVADDARVDWPGLVGLARSVAIYRLIPGRARRLAGLYGPIIRPGDLCFDVGAHVGNRSRALARLGARVIAIEPQPLFAAYLRRTVSRRENVTLLDMAVGDRVGETILNVSRRTPTVSTTDATWIEAVGDSDGFANVAWDRRVRVAQTTLDALIDRYGLPSFCKIDVEGGELAVLAGLSQPIAHISFEYMPAAAEMALNCVDRLAHLGDYRYRATVGESATFVSDQDWTPEEARAWIAGLPPQARSGDLHARLVGDGR